MERVLALQGLSEFISDDDALAQSDTSAVCSSQSSGTGKSSCSIACGGIEELDW